MTEVKSYYEAIKLLENSKVLAYKPLNSKITFLTLVKEDRIAVFNDNLHYNISFEELNELLKVQKVFIFDKDIETGLEFKN